MNARILLSATMLLACAITSGCVTTEPWTTLPLPPPMPQSTTSGYVENGSARIYFETFGSGPPVVLLHGGLANSAYWSNQVAALQKKYRVIVMDSRGHGRSTRDTLPFTYELMETDVVALLDHLAVPRAAVVGWSDGAIIGLVMAMRNPSRIERLFSLAANTDPSGVQPDAAESATFKLYLERVAKDYERLSPTPTEFAAFSAAIGEMWQKEPNYSAQDLHRITTPVAVAAGEHDEAIKREHTIYVSHNIPGSTLIILPKVSHFAILQDPKMINEVLLDFLSTLAAGASPSASTPTQ